MNSIKVEPCTMANQQSESSSPTEHEMKSEQQGPSAATSKTGNTLDVQSSSSSLNTSPDISTDAPPPPSEKKCSHCSFLSTSEEGLKPCTKCHTAVYCSRDCVKAAWKTHKKTCASEAQIYALTTDAKPASAPRVPKREGHRGGLQKWQFDT